MRNYPHYNESTTPEANRNRQAELSPVVTGGMYLTRNDSFNFLRHGRLLYTMPYNEAEVLKSVMTNTGKVEGIRILRAFRPQLSLSDAKDICYYVEEHFVVSQQ